MILLLKGGVVLKILVISPEAGDVSQMDGLAQTVNGMVRAYLAQGAEVRAYSPCYGCHNEFFEKIEPLFHGNEPLRNREFEVVQQLQSPFFYVRSDDYNRHGRYTDESKTPYPDNHFRFSLLVLGALQHALNDGFIPDFIHCHEWAAGLAGAYAKGIFGKTFGHVPIVLTLHNVEYDFHFIEHDIEAMGLERNQFHIDGFEYWGKVSMLKAAVLYADHVVFPSEGYRAQILEEDFGGGIRGFLEMHRHKIRAIQQGIEYREAKICDAKDAARQNLRQLLGLEIDATLPVVYCHLDKSTRRTAETLFTLWTDFLRLPIHLVVGAEQGSLEADMLKAAVTQAPERMALLDISQKDALKSALSGSDLLFLSASDEPSASLVLKAMACGTIALAGCEIGCATLLSSIDQNAEQDANAFLVESPWPDQMLRTLRFALEMYSQSPENWLKMVQNARDFKFSIQQTARAYMDFAKAEII